MASLSVLTVDHEGHPIQFDTWLDDLQLYLLSDSRDSISLFDHTSGASLAPPATADSVTRSQWLTRDVAARLAVRNHLPLAERAHFGLHKTAKALYDIVIALENLITHLHTSNTRYRAAVTAEFLDKNPPLMYITLYFIVTCLPDSLPQVRDHLLALDPTDLTVDLLEKHLLGAETSGGQHSSSRTLSSASPPTLACPALPSLRRGAAARRSSNLLVSPDDCSPADSPLGCVGPSLLRLKLREWFSEDFPVLCLHSSFTLPASLQQNGVAERRIGLAMELARTSMIHATAPHFLRPFAVWYAAHQLNLWLCVSLPETLPTLRWTGKVGDASVFQVWCSRAFVRDTSAPFPASSLAFPLTRLAGSFTTPPRAVFCPLRTSRLTSRFPFTISFPNALP
ncbi:unnamed protein product [Closterium sp. NIES-54]